MEKLAGAFRYRQEYVGDPAEVWGIAVDLKLHERDPGRHQIAWLAAVRLLEAVHQLKYQGVAASRAFVAAMAALSLLLAFGGRGAQAQSGPPSDVRRAFEPQGMDPSHSTPQEFAQLVQRDAERWARLIQAQNIKAE